MNAHFNQRYRQIGLDRLVRIKWLERTAELALSEKDPSHIRKILREELRDSFQSKSPDVRGSSLDKTIAILMKIWVRPPRELSSLQKRGLKLLSSLPREEHLPINWGMTMAVYPFWGSVASHVGRLLKLQGKTSQAQIRRRAMEQYGQRATVKYAVKRLLRSMVDWGVLRDAGERGVRRKSGLYIPGISLTVTRREVIAWLVEAFLYSLPSNSMAFSALLSSTRLFPFRISPISALHLAAHSPQLDVLQHGLDQFLIMLQTESHLRAATARL